MEVKELRIVLDLDTHAAFKAKARLERRSLKGVIETLIDDYIADRLSNVMKEDMIEIDRLITKLSHIQKAE